MLTAAAGGQLSRQPSGTPGACCRTSLARRPRTPLLRMRYRPMVAYHDSHLTAGSEDHSLQHAPTLSSGCAAARQSPGSSSPCKAALLPARSQVVHWHALVAHSGAHRLARTAARSSMEGAALQQKSMMSPHGRPDCACRCSRASYVNRCCAIADQHPGPAAVRVSDAATSRLCSSSQPAGGG